MTTMMTTISNSQSSNVKKSHARNGRYHITLRRPTSLRAATLTLTMAALLFANCGKKDPVAGLNELPRDVAVKLQSTPNARLLATKVEQTNPGTPPVPPPNTLCPQDWTFEYYDAQVTMPVTICTREEERSLREDAWFLTGSTKTIAKLTDPKIFADLKDGVLWQPPLVCDTTDGPWLARITVERACIGT